MALHLQCCTQLRISLETNEVLEKTDSMLGHNNLQLFLKAGILVCKYLSLPVKKAQYMLREIRQTVLTLRTSFTCLDF